MVLFGGYDLILMPKAIFVEARPEPGKLLHEAPTAVLVTFSREIKPESNLSVLSTVTMKGSGEISYSGGERVSSSSSVDIYTPGKRSLKVILTTDLPSGLYRVDWSTVTAESQAKRYGSYYFGVDMPVPDHILREGSNSLREEDVNYSDEVNLPRSAVATGLLLMGLSAFGKWIPRTR